MRTFTAVFPWAVIGGLLWAGVFIKPQPSGQTVQPPEIERQDNFYGIATPNGALLWVAGNNGKILRSEDGGTTWQRQTLPVALHLHDIAAWDAERAIAVGNQGVVLVTRDAGKNWKVRETPKSTVANKLLRVRALPNNRAWAVGEMGALLESADGGDTWQRRRAEEDVAWNDIVFVDEQRAVVVGEHGRMLRTLDGGANWQPIETPVKTSLTGVAFRDASNGIAVGLEGAVLVTRDGGATWAVAPRASMPIGAVTQATLIQEEELKSAGPGTIRPPVLEEAGEHLFGVAWNAATGHWIAVGNQGVWMRAAADAQAWEAGRVAPRDMSWHVRVAVVEGRVYLAGANLGEIVGSERAWRVFKSK